MTPQELAAALKSIESRSPEAAPRDDRTVLIGEALRDLNLDWSPEEVLAEIEARRVRQAQALLATRRVKRNRILALAVALCALTSIWAAYQGFWIAPSVAGRPHMVLRSHFTGISDPGFDAGSEIRPLSTLPENRPIHVSTFTLGQILEGQPPTQILVDARENLAASWTIVKRDGAIYIRAWRITPSLRPPVTVSPKPPAGTIEVYSDPSLAADLAFRRPPGPKATPITLRVGAFKRFETGWMGPSTHMTVAYMTIAPITPDKDTQKK